MKSLKKEEVLKVVGDSSPDPLMLPPVTLAYLKTLTDETGILQFAHHRIPDPKFGYTTDDNARALVVATLVHERTNDPDALSLAIRYLSFLRYVQRDDGWFHNYVSYDRRFLEGGESDDCFGRCLWALGTVMCRHVPDGVRGAAEAMFFSALPRLSRLQHLRGKALALLGLYEASRSKKALCPSLLGAARQLADDLCFAFINSSDRNWRWFEEALTYANGVLCEGLLRAFLLMGEKRYRTLAIEALQFLNEACTEKGVVSLIGNKGWFPKGGKKARFDQQPIDAFWLCWANWTAWIISGKKDFYDMAKKSWAWFMGHNLTGFPLYDPKTGACHDGLLPDGVKGDCGAEATLSALLSLLRMHLEGRL